ncbi:MAG: flagellar basal body rod protein FlgC [Deltaproteobacteria bacterium RBG_19FT_COMBO_58_16]|nr:MAG: flagellar basal body rod protein FlgC [Deltaproteobacteria bacterium RBG_19FT_COMBO_58_16]
MDMFKVSASGMEAQRLRMNIIASNLANVETTRTANGGAYRRKDIVFAAQKPDFNGLLQNSIDRFRSGVEVAGIIEDQRPFKQAYEPNHPDADDKGYVAYPNINAAEEMVNMISATRSYEANVAAYKATRDMALKALELGQ